MSAESDGEADDEDRLAAALAVLALTRAEGAPIGVWRDGVPSASRPSGSTGPMSRPQGPSPTP